jgi:hypothetical protein
MAQKATLNLQPKSSDWRARRLCPFAEQVFYVDQAPVRTIEGFSIATRIPPLDKRRIIALTGSAKNAHKECVPAAQGDYAWWKNEIIEVGSMAHKRFLERAIRLKYFQDARAQAALVATKGLKLTHRRRKPKDVRSTLPAKWFCDLLMTIRKELLDTGEVRVRAA